MIKKISFMNIIIVMFLACKTINTDAKIWKNNPPYNFIGKELLSTAILDSKKEEYIKLLSEQSFFIIPKDEYIRMTGKIPAKKYIIALRVLYTNLGGRYEVIQNDVADILIWYGVLGTGRKVYKTVLLVEVDQLPNNVYVSYSIAK